MSIQYFNEEHEQLRRLVRRFVESEIKPYADEWEKARMVPREVIRKMGELGFFGIRVPERFGGADMNVLGWVVLAEELGRSTFAGVTGVATIHSIMAAPHLLHAGTEAQLEKYMPGIVTGEILTAIAVSEADAGSDVGAIRTRAVRSERGWVLNGSKFYISNGVNADVYFVAARTDSTAKGANGISMFIVEKGTPGFRVGQQLEKMGYHSNDTAELIFEDCVIPHENLLGVEGKGFYAVMKNFQNERLVLTASNVGEAMTALKMTIDYVRERKTFGLPLIERQTISHRLAMLHARAEAGRQLVYHAASLLAKGEQAVREVSMCKAYWGELVNEVMYTCLQFHGGFGYLREGKIERMARDARLCSIGGGATEIMLDEIAKRWDDVPYWM
ncbi:acyl-CoA dehydrogenase family protein [Noviherbaspirillum sedimenti]|uniref:Acyl-CoA dehydrogenase n=1 Tax=Noviherbaspirillum sedimenti TaxID=2320865 RepID=A0A3A3G7X8_9BURK|nr:acyl-CoA dehydrogenase family protein [Noviherbaspirillum sedimenti]RJG02662.1 acyl-CoA dehydrogenase [Noviherbaspirillum sedimenti]